MLPDGSEYNFKDEVSGYIPSPSGASSGEFLKYNGTSWVADVVPGGASPSDTTPSASTASGSAGTAAAYSRGDHAHPTDTSRAPLASPTFTGTPTAPTATAGTSSTQIATTEFVQNAVGSIENVFIAIYDSTTYSEIENAYTAGKLIFCLVTNEYGSYEVVPMSSITTYLFNAHFTIVYPSLQRVDIDCMNDVWSYALSADSLGAISASGTTDLQTTIANGDRLIIRDVSMNNRLISSSLEFGTSTTQYLANNGTWQNVPTNTDTKTSFYGTSSTGSTTQAKTTASITDYTLRTGNIVAIKFSNANTYVSAKITLNVNSTGAKDVWYQGAVTSSTNTLTWNAGQTLTFVYTGSVYICISKDDIVPEITFVKYGTATFAEVEAAQGNGKLVIAYNQNEVQRFAPYTYYDTGGAKHKFYYIDEDGEILIWTLDSNNTWSTSSSNWYVPRTRTINSQALSSNITLDADDVGATPDGLVYASQTAFASVTALQTQLTTWFTAMSNQSERIFYITFSSSATGTIPFAKGTGIIVHLQKGTSAGMAVFYGRTGNPATGTKVATMSYVSSAWSEFTSIATTDDINTAIGSAILASY